MCDPTHHTYPNRRARHKAKIAMKRAWALAREGRARFGGKLRAYLAAALRLAWAEVAGDPLIHEADAIIASIRARRAANGGVLPAMRGSNYHGRVVNSVGR